MANSNKRNIVKIVILLILVLLIIFIAYRFAYDCNTVVIPPHCRFDTVTFVWVIIMLSVPIFSLSFIIRDIIHKTFFKKGKKIIDTLLILALIYCTISVIYYIKFRIDREPEWDAATARCNQINEIDKEYTAFLEEKDI